MAKKSGFGKVLKRLRQKAELTQSELADLAKISGAALSRIENSEREPSWDTLLRLARALNVPISEFDTGEDPRKDDEAGEHEPAATPEPAPKKKPRKR